ncbi:hypothetical protein [Brevundimonas diminuta]|uniref:Uncharacterized protein n=1 Tax=Brevundimonas diminuta TaxID=293 RepID=A0A1Z3LXK4_BREDI|nr:hypothetical protein [Brevundimonas diminuta]ASD26923.1 hypothetical protein CD943_08500 [Brevundimonas diminuta]
MSVLNMAVASAALALAFACPAAAQEASPDVAPKRPSLEVLERIIETRTPQTRIETPDHDRISARRIDIVDADGTIRMTLSGATPPPIIDGVQYKRAFNVAGLILYDDKGSERGGFGTADVEGGMAVLALDHPAMDAVGWRVSPNGSVSFVFNQAPPLVREPGLGGALVPGVQTPTRMRLSLAADGTPAVALSDRNDKPRLRLTVTEEGFGAIQFLNAEGQVIHMIAPEADLPTN